MIDTIAKRPLITFALFAYNQEKYIREAVESAFSQTYEPLEIILSDDCSSDRTYRIMQEMTASYEGPHDVRVTRTDVNLGVTPHILLRGSEARGEIVVVAAGDDISKPNRCSKHLPIYDDASVLAVSSKYDLIGDKGQTIKLNVSDPISLDARKKQSELFKNIKYDYSVIQGSTASYRKSVFSLPLPRRYDIDFSEDNLFNFLIYSNGCKVSISPESLIKYRMHDLALSNHKKTNKNYRDLELDSRLSSEKNIQKMEFFIWIAENAKDKSLVNFKELNRRLKFSRTVASWPDKFLLNRVYSVFLSLLSLDINLLKWKLARIIGKFPDYQPKKMLEYFRTRNNTIVLSKVD